MGGRSSKKNLDVQHLEGLQTTENLEDVERRKMVNPPKQGTKKRNTYLPTNKLPKQAGKLNFPKTGVGDGPKTVQTQATPSRDDGDVPEIVKTEAKHTSDVGNDPETAIPDAKPTRGVGNDPERTKPEAKPIRAKPSQQQTKRKPRPGSTFPKAVDDIGPHKRGEIENNPSKTVEGGSLSKEVSGSGAHYENVTIKVNVRKLQDSVTYENTELHKDCCGAQGSSLSGRQDDKAEMSLRRYYRELKERISVNDVCDHLIQNGVLRQVDCEDIKSKRQRKSADKLLQIILRKDQSAYEDFLDALRSTGFQDLVDKLQTHNPTERPCMRTWKKKVILKAWPKIESLLIKELSPHYIIDFFMQENIFSVDEYEVIFKCGNRLKMVKKLVETIHQKLPSSLLVLVYALEEIGKESERNNGKERERNSGNEMWIVKQLEMIINDESSLESVPGSDLEEETVISVKCKTEPEDACTAKGPVTRDGHYSLEFSLKKDGQTVHTAELAIDTFINTADSAIKLQVSLKPTDCKIISSEHGCIIINLWPQSRDAYQKLSEMCKKGELEKFVLNLLREKDIACSVPEGELSIDLKVSYHEEAEEIEETGEPQTDFIKLIKDNRSFLREEIEVQTLIAEILENKRLKKMFNDREITELKRLLAENRLQAADFFLNCLLHIDPKRRQSCIDTLETTTKTNIFKSLRKSESMYRNSQEIKENILHHYELVVDEIDPSLFEDTFMDREILDKTFFDDLREKQTRRRARAATFLKEVLDKGGRALFALVDVLREMGSEELVEMLTSQQREDAACVYNNDRKNYRNVDVYRANASEVLMWSCCMTVIVEKKRKDEKYKNAYISKKDKEPIYENVLNEQPTYENVLVTETDEGFDEGTGSIVRRPKTELSQSERPVTQPVSSFAHKSDENFVKVLTFPLTRGTEREKSKRAQINLSKICENDSAVDVGLQTMQL